MIGIEGGAEGLVLSSLADDDIACAAVRAEAYRPAKSLPRDRVARCSLCDGQPELDLGSIDLESFWHTAGLN